MRKRKSVPITPEISALLEDQRKRFVDKFGREPGPRDPIFFDENAATPQRVEAASASLLQELLDLIVVR